MPWAETQKNPAYWTPAWRKARAACLARARHRCEIRGPGCTGRATHADHVHGIAADPEHKVLQAACEPCHKAKTQREAAAGKRATTDPSPRPRTAW